MKKLFCLILLGVAAVACEQDIYDKGDTDNTYDGVVAKGFRL